MPDRRNLVIFLIKVFVLIIIMSTFWPFLTPVYNDALVGEADQVYGVSMEDGESKIMGIELPMNGEEQKNN